jgi:hypothetical protein
LDELRQDGDIDDLITEIERQVEQDLTLRPCGRIGVLGERRGVLDDEDAAQVGIDRDDRPSTAFGVVAGLPGPIGVPLLTRILPAAMNWLDTWDEM